MAQQQVTGVGLETLHSGNPRARVTETAIEALHSGVSHARVSDTAVEALVSIGSTRARRWVMISE
jgi:hypothetical protein